MEHQGLAVQLKRQMNDIIDVAYRTKSDAQRRQYKRFLLLCTDKATSSLNGDCRYLPDGSSQIRILRLKNATHRAILITTIHEVSHHITKSMHGKTGHGPDFYKVHLELLFAAFDMGLLTKEDVLNSGSNSRSLNRVIIKRNMLDTYVPHPVHYKQDTVQLFVYNAYPVKEALKARGYKWNALDAAWVLESTEDTVNEEQIYLLSINIQKENINIVNSAQVISRLSKTVCLYNVPYENQEIIKALGYRWNNTGKRKFWHKQINGDTLPEQEYETLEKMHGIHIVIT
jgi:hypothetical protein